MFGRFASTGDLTRVLIAVMNKIFIFLLHFLFLLLVQRSFIYHCILSYMEVEGISNWKGNLEEAEAPKMERAHPGTVPDSISENGEESLVL